MNVAANSIVRKKVRDDLKLDSTKLFEQFLKHPKDARLALAIKIVDDQIADCNERIPAENKSAEITEKNSVGLREKSSKNSSTAKTVGESR